jgi:excisionase family DNA binding protein
MRKPEESSGSVGSTIQRRAYKISEAAAALGVSPVTIRRLIDRGLLKPTRVLRHVLIPTEELDRLLRQ